MYKAVQVIGHAGGGTSATAGAFAHNDWNSRTGPPYFGDSQLFRSVFKDDIKQRTVFKTSCGVAHTDLYPDDPDILYLLVWRNPDDVIASLNRQGVDIQHDVYSEMQKILDVGKIRNWPVFKFSKTLQAQRELERLTNIPLPIRFIKEKL